MLMLDFGGLGNFGVAGFSSMVWSGFGSVVAYCDWFCGFYMRVFAGLLAVGWGCGCIGCCFCRGFGVLGDWLVLFGLLRFCGLNLRGGGVLVITAGFVLL